MTETSQIKYQEMDGSEMLKKATAIKGAAILVLLFGALLIANDLVLYNYLSKSRCLENSYLPSDQENLTISG